MFGSPAGRAGGVGLQNEQVQRLPGPLRRQRRRVLQTPPNEFGTGSGIVRMACTAPNPVCAMVAQNPWCVTSTTPGCTSPEALSCRGSQSVWCISTAADGGQERGHEQVTDCATYRTDTGAPYVCSVGTVRTVRTATSLTASHHAHQLRNDLNPQPDEMDARGERDDCVCGGLQVRDMTMRCSIVQRGPSWIPLSPRLRCIKPGSRVTTSASHR